MTFRQSNSQKYALISVFDKTGLVELAKNFKKRDVAIIATGATASHLEQNKIKVIPIEKITKMPESFDGRVKTISFQIAGGILFERGNRLHQKQAQEQHVPSINFVVCNFYPFWKNPGIDLIDVGGPTMVRAAAKNYKNVTVLVSPADYESVSKEIADNGNTSAQRRKMLASKAFSYVADYDVIIAKYFQNETNGEDLLISHKNGKKLRYGENAHQRGMFFKSSETEDNLGLGKFSVLQGKEISFNNYLDLDACVQAISLIGTKKPACVILKHTNPCGAAVATTIEEAFRKTWYDGDPLAAFGGVIVMNRQVTKKLAEEMLADKKFFEIVAAPGFSKDARKVFSRKPKLQLLENKILQKPYLTSYKDIRKVRGGFLVQDADTYVLKKNRFSFVTKKKPTPKQIDDLLFAWKICQVSKSNSVVAVKNNVLLASGVGQQDRKRCCELCVNKAIHPLTGAVAATDGFFPFRDGPDVLIKAGIKAIIQPGGSIRDQETIDACNEANVSMVFTGVRAFKH